MKRWSAVAVSALALCAACGSSVPAPASERTALSSSAIEDGATDTTHQFAVGIAQLSKLRSGEVALCSGVLLAPNLVATARHCVAQLNSSAEIDCATSTFGAVVPVNDILVTTDSEISPTGTLFDVSTVLVPSGANQTKVCGNDIALLILGQNIQLPQYVVPTIDPPMTDGSLYSTSVTAIGYGVSTPTDEAGVTAGERRIKENIALACIPDDPSFVDCFSDPEASQFLTAGEFVSGDASTCDGDSGSGAYDQASFDRGQWVAFGVLSRGAVSDDGDTCIEPIYERFDAWGALLVEAATQAATAGKYSPPAWVSATVEAGANANAVATSIPEKSSGSSGSAGCSAAGAPAASPSDSWAAAIFSVWAFGLARCRRGRKKSHISAPTAGTCSQ